jgi:hypothetical protein
MTAPSWVCARPPKRGDVEAALAALKGSAVLDRDTQTVEAMELMRRLHAVTNAKIAKVRTTL